MSSTNRSLHRLAHPSDYYVTPVNEITRFLKFILEIDDYILTGSVLDPCAGGSSQDAMSYPKAIASVLECDQNFVDTIDIRLDSLARIKQDYLTVDCKDEYQTIITNPPFNRSVPIIQKALDDVIDYGFVVMLQRLNFMGSHMRKPFWERNVPKYIVVHHRRMSFTRYGGTDSVEYAHYVWQKGWNEKHSLTYII